MNLDHEPRTNLGAPIHDRVGIDQWRQDQEIAKLKDRVGKLEQTLATLAPKLDRVFRIAGAE